MTGSYEDALPYLPPDERPVGLVRICMSWTAVSVPSDWGPLVRDVLGDRSGPVMADVGLRTFTWPLPAGSGAQWPDARAADVAWHGPGQWLFVPGLVGDHPVTHWLQPPSPAAPFTDPAALRAAIEFVAGPLEQAAALGPLAVCRYCGAPTRDRLLTETFAGANHGGYDWYACRPCWTATVGGGDARRLRAVRQWPR